MIYLIIALTFISTFLGGLFAVRFRDRLHLILGFSAGAVLGVAFFDLIPESIEILQNTLSISSITTITAIGFIVFMLIDRFISTHCHGHECDGEHDDHNHTLIKKGIFGASSLSIHSLIDGIAVGLAFQASTAIGIIVALAVLTHDFSDGINTVNVIMKNGGSKNQSLKWLTLDSLAPVVGIVSTFFFTVPIEILGYILAGFSGFFLYLGASDLLPESHHAHPRLWTTFMTILGMAFIYIVVNI
jgi:ZIP family zinc transporter